MQRKKPIWPTWCAGFDVLLQVSEVVQRKREPVRVQRVAAPGRSRRRAGTQRRPRACRARTSRGDSAARSSSAGRSPRPQARSPRARLSVIYPGSAGSQTPRRDRRDERHRPRPPSSHSRPRAARTRAPRPLQRRGWGGGLHGASLAAMPFGCTSPQQISGRSIRLLLWSRSEPPDANKCSRSFPSENGRASQEHQCFLRPCCSTPARTQRDRARSE